MIVAVFGANGMLGTEVCSELTRQGHSCIAATHAQGSIASYTFVRRIVDQVDAIINCAGLIHYGLPSDMVLANAVGPWIIAQNTNKPIIHVSTDCVFSGVQPKRFNFVTDDPSPTDLYGRTKLVGEVKLPHVCNVRTSFIGFRHGLLKWIVNNKNSTVEGRINCTWSGSTVQAVAEALVRMLTLGNRKTIEHLATERFISKYDVVKIVNDILNLGVDIIPVEAPIINRSLRPTIVLPPLIERAKDLNARYYSNNPSWAEPEQREVVGSSTGVSTESGSNLTN